MKKLQGSWALTNENIDFLSTQFQEFLHDNNVESKEVVRLRLSLEDVLLQWKKSLPENAVCNVNFGRRFRRPFVQLSVPGPEVNPYEIPDSAFGDGMASRNLLAALGLAPAYSYSNNNNILTLRPPKHKINPLITLFLAIILSLITSQLCILFLEPTTQQMLAEEFLSPLFDTFIRLISLLAGLMIFFSILWGIVGIGDINTLGTVGKKLIGRILLFMGGTSVLTLLVSLWFYPLDLSAGVSPTNLGKQIWQLLLKIVPGDFISPFQTGNSLQIIFMAIGLGLVILILGEQAEATAHLSGQINNIIQLSMTYVSGLAPYLIFVCILKMSLTGLSVAGWPIIKLVLLFSITGLLVQFLLTLYLARVTHASFIKICKILLPTNLIAFSTASSAAAFSDNRRCCIQQLGIQEKLVDFGAPLMQTLLKPSVVISYLIISLGMAELFQVPISPSWLLVAVLMSTLLALACPPVTGGVATCLTILFLQLGISTEALAICIPLSQLLDFQCTVINVWSDMTGLAVTANSLKMLDPDILQNK